MNAAQAIAPQNLTTTDGIAVKAGDPIWIVTETFPSGLPDISTYSTEERATDAAWRVTVKKEAATRVPAIFDERTRTYTPTCHQCGELISRVTWNGAVFATQEYTPGLDEWAEIEYNGESDALSYWTHGCGATLTADETALLDLESPEPLAAALYPSLD